MLLLIFCFSVFAQPSANFTSNVVSGCNPLIVSFTDLSTGNPTGWQWDFGNGNTSTLKNPQSSYTNPGTYTVSLTVSNASGSNTMTKNAFITVFKNPAANLTATTATTGCKPLSVSFSDQSQQGDGIITKWTWDFGDGGGASAKNPNYTYNTPGIYNVSLHVIDINGCSDTKVSTNYIQVYNTPSTAFSTAIKTFCKTPANTTFTNASTGSGSLTYYWDFGDGGSSTVKEPIYSYTSAGSYPVKLVVTDQNGCSDSIIKTNYILIKNVIANFNPDKNIVCLGNFVSFNNTSSGATTYLWDFDDGNTTTLTDPKYMYYNPGTYQVKLLVKDGNNCTDSIIKPIIVESVKAGFSASPVYSCKVPLVVNFTDLSTNAVTYNWFFGDGDTTSVKNPSHTYQKKGLYWPSLVVWSANGCSDTFTSPNILIQPPEADFIGDTMRGCAPITVDFTDLSTSKEPIISWKWDFGDGDTSILQNPTHTFVDDTIYKVKLTIYNSLGCVSTRIMVVEAGVKPVADFEIDRTIACAYDSVLFHDLSTNPSGKKNTEWTWIFGDGVFGSDTQIYHQHVDTGYLRTTLIVGQRGCYDTLVWDSSIYINAPVSLVETYFSCDSPFTYRFIQIPKGVDHWQIDFGDGVKLKNLTTDTVSHTYSNYGQFKVKTKAFNDSTGCTWPREMEVYVYDNHNISITFSDSTPCVGDSILFQSAHNIGTGTWYFGDSTTSLNIYPLHAYDKPGGYRVKLVEINANGCVDSISRFLRVYGLIADYDADSFVCVSVPVKFTDLSFSDTTITSWNWHFGDGVFSSKQNPTHAYIQKGSFSPSLIVENANGCIDTLFKPSSMFTRKPSAGFFSLDNALCLQDTAFFINNSSGTIANYLWSFGDGASSVLKTPYHLYINPGQYSVQLVVTDTGGCKDTARINYYMNVQQLPYANFYADSMYSNCYPLLVHFSDSSLSPDIVTWEWNFGDMTQSSFIRNPSHSYQMPGNYSVKLHIITSFGCTDSIEKLYYIKVRGPLADFELEPDTVCAGEFVELFITEKSSVYEFRWDFGDGMIVKGISDTALHRYSHGGLFIPKLIYVDSTGTCRKSSERNVFVSDVSAAFQSSDTKGEVPMNIDFTDFSSINAQKWIWNFGEGQDTFAQDVSHYYGKAGTYLVRLVVENDLGCLDTAIQLILVEPKDAVIDMPSAFTPNGDGINDEVKIRGYGTLFKELLEFRIFNRYGEIVFETINPEIGWNGYYKGKLQNMETYVYVVTVETYDGKTITQKGYISLLR
ncbi:PKD domain-containing protein [Bacteroidota bacterium]